MILITLTESGTLDEVVKLFVPLHGGLLQAIETLLESTDWTFLAGFNEAFQLFHIKFLLYITMEECRLDI